MSTRKHVIPTLFSGRVNHPKFSLTMSGSGLPSNTWLLGPPHPTCLTPSRSNQPSLHGSRSIIPILYFPTPKLPLSVLRSGPPSNTCMTVVHPTPHAKRHLDRSSRFCRVPKSFIPDRPTDHGNVSSNTPHRICYAKTMRREKKKRTVTYENCR